MKRGEIRPGEVAGAAPDRADAALAFIGRIRTPFATREDCPRQGSPDGPVCRVVVDEPWRVALTGLAAGARVELIYWMHLARRDLLVQIPRDARASLGTLALRSPNRPNPIATSVVTVVAVEEEALVVRGLDCVDGTPLLDIKPERRVSQ
jgi:tRNA-Thr(GGU) m(6)t(6)A37 methyltransferase TsaA